MTGKRGPGEAADKAGVNEESPLGVLARAVLAAKAHREAFEEELKRTPRWRFRRRRELERSLAARRAQERNWIELVKEASRTRPRSGRG
jgi:hypothetical protein